MAQNQTVADVKVKSAKILEGSPGPLGLGIVWGRPAQTNFVPLNKYKVQVTFGNASASVQYPDKLYRKDVVGILLAGKGFKVGDRWVDQVMPRFYTDESFSRTATPVAGSTSQTIITISVPLETDGADKRIEAFFRFSSPQLEPRNITSWHWQAQIFASVRNKGPRRNTASSV